MTQLRTKDEKIAFAFRNVDTQDIEWLRGRLGFGGHDQFWKAVLNELDRALRGGDGEIAHTENKNADIIDLGPHPRMTVEEVFASAGREPWDKVIICGFHKDGEDLVVRSSHISREFSLWIAEHLKLHILGRL